jgi:hypothetical protein
MRPMQIIVTILLFLPILAFAQTRLLINEIHYAPALGEPEWVEVFNASPTPVNLKNWKIRDATATKKTIATKDVLVPANAFALLVKDSAVLNYHDVVPCLIVTLTMPSLNNDSDNVIIYDASGIVIDSVLYHSSWGGGGGASLERVRLDHQTTSAVNWRTSRDKEKSSPGRPNSVIPPLLDVSVDSVWADRSSESLFTVHALVRNRGTSAVQSIVAEASDNSGALRAAAFIGTLASEQVVIVHLALPRLIVAESIIVRVPIIGDGDSTNDSRSILLKPGHRIGSVVVNEIMYAPQAPEPEWLELQNVSGDSIGVGGWKIGTAVLPQVLVANGEYVVFTRDSGALVDARPDSRSQVHNALIATLTNSAGMVVLKDDNGVSMDSVAYKSTWGGSTGISLERIDSAAAGDSANWRSSRDSSMASCGRRNERARRVLDVSLESITVDTSYHLIRARFKNVGLAPAGNLTLRAWLNSVRVDDPEGAMVASLAPSGWTTMNISLRALPQGVNDIRVEIVLDGDMDATNNARDIRIERPVSGGSIVINEIMFAPTTGHAEYIELVNIGEEDVNLNACTVTDAPSLTTHVADTTRIRNGRVLAPGGYAVIAGDTSLDEQFPELSGGMVVEGSGGLGLNNDSDAVALHDAHGNTIDSVHYSATWHTANVTNETGVALERVNARLPSNDKRSWASSVAARGGTPDAQNSVFAPVTVSGSPIVSPDLGVKIAPNPFSPDGDGRDDIAAIHIAFPFSAGTARVRVLDIEGRVIRTISSVERVAREATLVWDGRDEAGMLVPLGVYYILVEAANAATFESTRSGALVVVAGGSRR